MSAKTTFIENLRSKPEPVRKRIAAALTICLTLIIVALWGISFRESLNALSLQSQEKSRVVAAPAYGGPGEHLKRIALGARTLFNDIAALGSAAAEMAQ
ncbi:MAG TPA: hypothetical protein DCZ84_02205 [Candidatus Vogelbacteria bacterium]|uniref:Uncharacterized protein n=1 Tax=Candidatus Vogelbacteria bacterium RIFOXYD1_FULL_51_18 TaxID=1802440 RepID=A0A1G2QHY9_9BACT|nr:MAG: hypothetical protein UY66_C0005G0011 [Parcubacteria group bacterium GW2011_GWC1_51_35]KKW25344.1 MAG: hypothetical protein UY68_C0003G0044 [Parcubacteria group bacterium GW2011_GWF2_52_12]KKW27306.1 MAG: hypothetical protein UY69_C0015G0008 [Parcubacteria group bacterium GW2011_GWF1_52_5]KKW35046.1 MAG: hypothetical protein UY80_C0001G0031 [Parcubacteria group bacterium GW2011_GWB1_53_43]KKW38784.1 MAG: hypothetical protein UY88_C0001G0010 [Parcubacteria group bacterium GW2011_GWA1_54_8